MSEFSETPPADAIAGEFVTETFDYDDGLSASPGGGYRPPDAMPSRLPRTYLVAGTREPFFLENAARWAAALRGAHAEVVMTERPAGHDDEMWRREFPLMIRWAFGRSGAI